MRLRNNDVDNSGSSPARSFARTDRKNHTRGAIPSAHHTGYPNSKAASGQATGSLRCRAGPEVRTGTGAVTISAFGALGYTGSATTAKSFSLGGGTLSVSAGSTLTFFRRPFAYGSKRTRPSLNA